MKNTTIPPKTNINTITPPKILIPIIEAFQAKTDKEIKTLVMDLIQSLLQEKPNKQELRGLVYLIKSLKPNNSLEALYASQFVISYLLGMRKLTAAYPDDQKIGLKLLSFSNKTLQQLCKNK